ncbi:hypothetical protein EPUS_01356 [Endocarpon pusillum Z07020]|uniref:Trichodiene oxygenase n=1 Tax=Endocarpon pusillum (strain Z07020 / HMAS-L-300199) TaxID=1263415 RepID=U1HYN3_ENDPU|nr:uncharacterized protein EPUS_01356 [Endocarpon pusillum Z07020]ERF75990.1 hypothetical protein EPUS_01356 [Endocarpon pusillum Z07020]
MDFIKQGLAEKQLLITYVVTALLVSWATYFVGLGFYRVFLSPLAAFPGPKLAALTTWYQAYYDIWLHGQYFRRLDRIHEEYGPIVRINPHELHVNDPFFIEELYSGSAKKRDKYKWVGRATLRLYPRPAHFIIAKLIPTVPDSLVATVPHDHHRKRRAAINPYFSKASIRKLDPVIQNTLVALLKRMDQSAKSPDVFHASLAYKAVTCDIITEFSFGVSTDYMARNDYEHSFFKAVDDHLHMSWMMAYIAWLGPAMNSLPPSIMGLIYPGLKHLWNMHSQWVKQIEKIRTQDKLNGNGTVFHGLLNSDLPPSEKTDQRLRQEAQLLVLAGQDTTAYTLSSLTYELLANHEILQKLKEELEGALPDLNTPFTSAQLEQLPYLTGIIQEGIRLHPGAIIRQTRIAPEQNMIYRDACTEKEWVIPAGVPVSMDARSCNLNPKVFVDPHKFIPERWLENPRLDKYMLTFSRGTRMCLGMNLAYSELYIIIAEIFRRYELYDGTDQQTAPTLALYDTIRERDVDIMSDWNIPFPTKGSKGIQVKVGRSWVD